MLRYAKDKGVARKYTLVTDGSLLTPRLAREIMDVGPTYLQISLEAVSDVGYLEVSRAKVDYDKIVGERRLPVGAQASGHDDERQDMDSGSATRRSTSSTTTRGMCDSRGMELPISYTQPEVKDTSLGIMKGTTHDMYESTYKEVCTLPFYTMNINFNGNVSASSFDWRHGLIMGNANDESLRSIWEGREYTASASCS